MKKEKSKKKAKEELKEVNQSTQVVETVAEESKVKKNKIFALNVTKMELVHLRDMLSILYPSESKRTISQTLADSESRLFEESNLWKKVASLCEDAGLPVGDEAPDYAIVPIGHPPMGVFMLSEEESELMSGDGRGFLKNEHSQEEE